MKVFEIVVSASKVFNVEIDETTLKDDDDPQEVAARMAYENFWVGMPPKGVDEMDRRHYVEDAVQIG